MAPGRLARSAILDVHRRRQPVRVLLTVAVLEFGLLYLVTLLGAPRNFVGLPGPVAVLIAVGAAALEGPVVGALAALIAGVAFIVVTADFGRDVEILTVLYATLVWLIAAVVTGTAADQARRQIRGREDELSLALGHAIRGQDAIQRVLELAPTFRSKEHRERLEESICEAALETFQADASWLFDLFGETLLLRARTPAPPGMPARSILPWEPEPSVLQGSALFLETGTWEERGLLWLAELAEPLGIHACMIMPLRAEESTMRVLVLGWRSARSEPDPAEKALLRRFADQAALALEQAEVERLHARLEANLLPHFPIEHPSLRVRTLYRPGDGRLGLGGDFLDFLPLEDGGAAFVIGDVSGHGVDAAALGAVLRSTWRALTVAGTLLPDVMRHMHEVLCLERADRNLFATVLAGTLAPTWTEATFASAGHVPPILLADGARELPLPPQLPLGCWERRWESTTIELPSRWTLFLYTDGLVEGRTVPRSRERFGVDRLLQTLDQHRLAEAANPGLEGLLSEIRAANGAELADDVAALSISGTSTTDLRVP